MSRIDELRAEHDAAAAVLEDQRRAARHSRADEADAAERYAAAAQAVELETWVQAQRDLGVPEEHIDADRRIVTNLPLGPVHVAGNTASDDAAVTFAHDSAEADAIRRDPTQGAILAADMPTNPAAHLPYEHGVTS